MADYQKSIKQNFIYNAILKILNIVFPLITFPYVARVLLAEGIGKVNFSLSVIEYFILISQAGIPTYAIRECAKYRDDKEKLTKTVQEILLINTILVIISYLLFLITIFTLQKLHNYKTLLFIASINIFATNLGIEWFYQAIEEYRFITIRSFVVKMFSLFLVFIFIKKQNDFFIYAIITVLSLFLSSLYNFIHLRKYISIFTKYKNYNIKKHFKPIGIMFGTALSISIYVNLDKVMLGLISGDRSVGLYTASNRIIRIILSIVTSLGTVLLPRMSYYVKNNKDDEINTLIKKSIDFILLISIPSVIGIIMLAKPIILLFVGNDYIESVLTIKILSPIIIAIALSNLIGIQILVSQGKEKMTLFSTIIGAIINFLLNLILIPKFQQNGAAIATLIAEVCVTIIQILLAYSYIKGNIIFKNISNYFIGGLIIVLICICFNYIDNIFLKLLLSLIFSVCGYFVFLLKTKNEITSYMANKIFAIIKSNH